ncbi:MAG TPA: EAL domain-containing protein [Usitatibacter sp.]
MQLAHGLGLTVVAEGVETESQMQLLKAQGCDEIQGFLISRPLTAREIEKYL